MLRLRTVLQYAFALFAALFITGFFEGLLLPASTAGAFGTQSIASSAVALALSIAIFMHLAATQRSRTIELAALAVAGQFVIGTLLHQVAPTWIPGAGAVQVALEQLLVLVSLAIGVPLGIKLRNRHAPRAEA
jgi:hypothetical protein